MMKSALLHDIGCDNMRDKQRRIGYAYNI